MEKLLSTIIGVPVPVSGLVVIVGAKEITVRQRPEAVAVLRATVG